jgi:hypothetical protein
METSFRHISDFETLLCPITSQTKTNTQLLNKHEPTGIMLYCVSTYDDVPFETTYFYRGVDCMDKFYKCLNKLSHDIREVYNEIIISDYQKRMHELEDFCCICRSDLLRDRVKKLTTTTSLDALEAQLVNLAISTSPKQRRTSP